MAGCSMLAEEQDSIEIIEIQEPEIDSVAIWKAAQIDSFFQDRTNRGKFNGTVLFADSGKVIFKGAYGYADLKSKDTLETTSAFQLASCSKPITALAVLLLIDDDKISLTDSIQKFIPDFPYHGITVKMLLIHRHGLSNYMYFSDKYWADWNKPISNADVLDIMKKWQPAPYYLPNRRYNYSNTGYMLLASIIEQASGMSYDKFVETRIFKKLGMNDSFIFNSTLDPKRKNNGVKGYRSNGREAPDTYQNGVVGDKGVYSTVEDLFRLDQALYNGELISDQMLDSAFTKAHPELYDNDNYGLGWRIQDFGFEKIVYHGGWWKGFKTYIIRVLPQRYTIIVLSNKQKGFLKVPQLRALMEDPPEVNNID